MRPATVIFLLTLCVVPRQLSAQDWADAYHAGDYLTAANLLSPLVIGDVARLEDADPDRARHLAILYARGLGVARDPVVACSLARFASIAAQMVQPRYVHSIAEFEAYEHGARVFVEEHCDGLSERDRVVATLSIGCLALGMPDQDFALGDETVIVSREGVRLAGNTDAAPGVLVPCPQLVARVRALTIEPPSDAAPGVVARHFIEMLFWSGGHTPQSGQARYDFTVGLFELRGRSVAIIAQERLHTSDRWPVPALPPDIDRRFTMEMIRSGHVRWRFAGTPPKRGWILLPGESVR